MDRYWVPSNVESALFGTKITDRFFIINQGGDIAFLNGTLKQMIAADLLDWRFVGEHCTGFQELAASLAQQSWEELEQQSGVSRAEMAAFAQMIGAARRAVFVWSMGITQHTTGEDAVRAIINLALTRGFVGREGCGVMPIRGHSGVQGGAEMGAYATVFPGGVPIDAGSAARFAELWGFGVPANPGLTAPEMIDAAAKGQLDLLVSVGGNFLEVLPEPDYVQAALERVPLRVHMDIVLTRQMLLDPAETVLLLPATTRYEIPGGVTETTTERRVIFSPEIDGPRIGEARSEGDVFLDLARRVRPELGAQLRFADMAAMRAEIARAVPMYEGIQQLAQAGDQFQYGGPHLCADWRFPTADGKAHFSVVATPHEQIPPGAFRVTTRRGKQFNSMIHERKDMITGATREAVFISQADAERLGLHEGEAVTLRNAIGQFQGRVFIAPVKPGNIQIHWPEGNVLIQRDRRSPVAGIPDYNALAWLEKGASPVEAGVAAGVS
jgi:molybdopterin-dependent oxidoreductase alpha subunit